MDKETGGAIGCFIGILVLSIAGALFTLALYFLVFQALLKYVTGS